MHARRPTRAASVRSGAPLGWTRARGKVAAVRCKATAVASQHVCSVRRSPQAQVAPPLPVSRDWLHGKDVLVLGMSPSGTAATKLAAVHGARVFGLDEGVPIEELWSRARKQIPSALHDNVCVTNNPINYDELEGFDLVVLADGISVKDRLPAQALASNIPVTSELAFAAAMLPPSVDIVCVTGNTSAKSTTVSFLKQMMTAMEHRVWSGGDSSRPLSALAYETATSGGLSPHVAAIEVSPSQLQPEGQFTVTAAACIEDSGEDVPESHQSQDITLAQAKLMDHVKPGSLGAIVSQEVGQECDYKPSVQGCARIGSLPGIMLRRTEAQIMHRSWRTARSLDLSPLQFPGSHNMANAAVAAFLAASVAPGEQQWKKLQACIPDLVGLPHRMELVHKDVHGVRWVDDSVSTSVKSVQHSLETLPGQAVVMLGGSAQRLEKGRLGFDALAPLLKQHKVIAFGASANKIVSELQESGVVAEVFFGLREAVAAARKASVSAGLKTVLLSPACDSFDEFNDDVDRGNKFTAYATG